MVIIRRMLIKGLLFPEAERNRESSQKFQASSGSARDTYEKNELCGFRVRAIFPLSQTYPPPFPCWALPPTPHMHSIRLKHCTNSTLVTPGGPVLPS